MKKIYKLTAVNIQDNSTIEECYFTSKNKATQSLEYLREYMIQKHSLNKNNIHHYIDYKDVDFILDNRFNISLISHDIKTQKIKYIK